MKTARYRLLGDMLFVIALATLPVACAMEAKAQDGPPENKLADNELEQARAAPTGYASMVRLTAEQQQALQAEVISHLNDFGRGTQIGINQISFDAGRTIVVLSLPGEAKVSTADESIGIAAATDCHNNEVGWACLWANTNFTGARIERFDCGTLTLPSPWNSSTASIYNHQTTGTQTIILNGSGQILNASQAPSRINDTGVLNRSQARRWIVCP